MCPTAIETPIFPSLSLPRSSARRKPAEPIVVLGDDGLVRPSWVGTDPLLTDYYDHEWGDVAADEQTLFEVLSLLVFQAGLRWRSVLARRTALRSVFGGFSPDLVASFGEKEIELILQDPRVFRNQSKVRSIVTNAQATVDLRSRGGLAELVWSHQPQTTPMPLAAGDLPPTIPESHQLAADLKSAGFRFVGPRSAFALMQSVGVVDANPLDAHKRGSTGLWYPDGTRKRSVL